MDARGIAPELARMEVQPGNRSATLSHDFGKCHVRGKRVIYRHYARASLGKTFSHEAGIGAVEQAPEAAMQERKYRRRLAGRRRKNVESFWLACAIGNAKPARQARAHARALG